MQEPTVGRAIWYWPSGKYTGNDAQPLSAEIAHVNEDGTINIGFLGSNGAHNNAVNVPIIDRDSAPTPEGGFCDWMPYQKGQAKKAEELEQQLATQTGSLQSNGGDVRIDSEGKGVNETAPQ